MPAHANPSQASLADLKAVTAEHIDRFAAEGKTAVKGGSRRPKAISKDPFDKPSPGLIKRLAAEARNDAKQRVFQDEAGPSDHQRREILQAKAQKYEAMRRGDYSGMTDRELEENVIDFDRKDTYSEHSSDEDESAQPAEDLDQVEYVDEMGRTRMGTRRDAERSKKRQREPEDDSQEQERDDSAYAEVLQSNVIHGEQRFFPVYEPDADALRAKYKAAEEEARAHHYDSRKEVRTRGAGQYQFSLDEEERAQQMADLKSARAVTETARSRSSAIQAARKKQLEERKAAVAAKRALLLGGAEKVEQLKRQKREAEAEALLNGVLGGDDAGEKL